MAPKTLQLGRPKAILLSPKVWHTIGGHEKYLTARLARRFEVTVLDLVDFGGRYKKMGKNPFPLPEGARLVERPTPPTLPLQGLYLELANGLRVLFCRAELLVTYLTLGGVLAALAARLRGLKILFIYADDYVAFYRAKSRLAGWMTANIANPLVARLADGAAATARLLAEDLRPYNPGVEHIPNGVDAARLAGAPPKTGGPFRVGFIGGFGHWVDFESILEAARRLPEVEFRLIGGGDRFDEVEAMSHDLANVSLTGPLPYDRVVEEMGRLDACLIAFKVNPLTDRVSPIKLFESWAANRPAICSPVREVLETAGQPGDQDAAALYYQDGAGLAGAIAKLQADPALGQRLAAEGAKRLAEHDWDRLMERYWGLLRQMGFEADLAGEA